MDVSFRLKKIHELILGSLALTKSDNFEDLVTAVRLMDYTDFNYMALLDITVKGVADRDSLFFLARPNAPRVISRHDIEREFSVLEMLELVSKERVLKAAKGSNVKEGAPSSYYRAQLTEEGERIAAAVVEGRKPLIRPKREERTNIFIASSLKGNDVNELLETVIEPTCKELGYEPLRVDQSEHSHTITNEILEGIRSAACLVADLTYSRPSVYFEIGLAQGLGVPFVLTCRQDHFRANDEAQKVHFDLEQFKISYWTTPGDGKFIWDKKMHPKERLQRRLPSSRETVGSQH